VSETAKNQIRLQTPPEWFDKLFDECAEAIRSFDRFVLVGVKIEKDGAEYCKVLSNLLYASDVVGLLTVGIWDTLNPEPDEEKGAEA